MEQWAIDNLDSKGGVFGVTVMVAGNFQKP